MLVTHSSRELRRPGPSFRQIEPYITTISSSGTEMGRRGPVGLCPSHMRSVSCSAQSSSCSLLETSNGVASVTWASSRARHTTRHHSRGTRTHARHPSTESPISICLPDDWSQHRSQLQSHHFSQNNFFVCSVCSPSKVKTQSVYAQRERRTENICRRAFQLVPRFLMTKSKA